METRYYVYKYIDGNGEIVYVGCTKDLAQRHYNHHIDPFFHCELWYADCGEKMDALFVKQYLIRKHRPKYNRDFSRDKSPSFEIENLDWHKFTK